VVVTLAVLDAEDCDESHEGSPVILFGIQCHIALFGVVTITLWLREEFIREFTGLEKNNTNMLNDYAMLSNKTGWRRKKAFLLDTYLWHILF